MIRNILIAIGLTVACSASAANKVVKANGKVELSAAGGMMSGHGDMAPMDAVGLSITSDGTSIRFTATLKDPPGADATAPVTISIDTDNNPATGKKGFGDEPGGFEYLLEMALCIQYEDHSTSCAGGSMKSKPSTRYGAADLRKYKDAAGNYDSVLSSIGFPGEKKATQYPVDGKTLTVSIEYADIGAKSGQTIRLVSEKTGGTLQHDAPTFDDVLLTLR